MCWCARRAATDRSKASVGGAWHVTLDLHGLAIAPVSIRVELSAAEAGPNGERASEVAMKKFAAWCAAVSRDPSDKPKLSWPTP